MVSRAQSLSEQDLRDLGFGTVVSRESHQRLLNRDGSFNVERRGLHFWSSFSLYHALLTMPWWQFILVGISLYVVANTVFALAYVACGPAALASTTPGIEQHTRSCAHSSLAWRRCPPSATAISYPRAWPPMWWSRWRRCTGLAGFAIVTGLLFARLSRPTAKVLFSRHAVIAPYRDITAFEFRVANARSNELIQVSAYRAAQPLRGG